MIIRHAESGELDIIQMLSLVEFAVLWNDCPALLPVDKPNPQFHLIEHLKGAPMKGTMQGIQIQTCMYAFVHIDILAAKRSEEAANACNE